MTKQCNTCPSNVQCSHTEATAKFLSLKLDGCNLCGTLDGAPISPADLSNLYKCFRNTRLKFDEDTCSFRYEGLHYADDSSADIINVKTILGCASISWLKDVSDIPASGCDIMTYDATTNLWTPKAIGEGESVSLVGVDADGCLVKAGDIGCSIFKDIAQSSSPAYMLGLDENGCPVKVCCEHPCIEPCIPFNFLSELSPAGFGPGHYVDNVALAPGTTRETYMLNNYKYTNTTCSTIEVEIFIPYSLCLSADGYVNAVVGGCWNLAGSSAGVTFYDGNTQLREDYGHINQNVQGYVSVAGQASSRVILEPGETMCISWSAKAQVAANSETVNGFWLLVGNDILPASPTPKKPELRARLVKCGIATDPEAPDCDCENCTAVPCLQGVAVDANGVIDISGMSNDVWGAMYREILTCIGITNVDQVFEDGSYTTTSGQSGAVPNSPASYN